MMTIPAQLEGYRSLKDGSIKVTFETNELNPQQLLEIAENLNKFGFLAFKQQPFTLEEKKVTIEHLLGVRYAHKVINESIELYDKTFRNNA